MTQREWCQVLACGLLLRLVCLERLVRIRTGLIGVGPMKQKLTKLGKQIFETICFLLQKLGIVH